MVTSTALRGQGSGGLEECGQELLRVLGHGSVGGSGDIIIAAVLTGNLRDCDRPTTKSAMVLLTPGMKWELDELKLRSNSSCYSAPPSATSSKSHTSCNFSGCKNLNQSIFEMNLKSL